MKIENLKMEVKEFRESKCRPNVALLKSEGAIPPELTAAIGASLSRNPATLSDRVAGIKEKTVKNIMRFFKDYGHSSIGEMGNFIFQVEGVTMLTALQIITYPRFLGQEASTRYINWKKQSHLHINGNEFEDIPKKLFGVYDDVCTELTEKFKKEGMDEKEAKPKIFDIAGGFLPTCAKTSVFVNTNIRDLIDMIVRLKALNTIETGSVANSLIKMIKEEAPNSFSEDMVIKNLTERRESILNSERLLKRNHIYKDNFVDISKFDLTGFHMNQEAWDVDSRNHEGFGDEFGVIDVYDSIAFRDLRDIWRHRVFRKAFYLPPLRKYWFDDWYTRQLPDLLRLKVYSVLGEIYNKVKSTETLVLGETLHPLLPLCAKVNFRLSGTVNHWHYFMGLRSTDKVHPNVLNYVGRTGENFKKKIHTSLIPEGRRLKTNYSIRKKDE